MAALTSSSVNNIGDVHPNEQHNVSATSRHSNNTVGYHGNCSKCHHLHTSKPVVLPTDRRQHKRICCDVCGYYMGGLGGNSTQISLASVETIRDATGPASTSVARPVAPPCSNTSSRPVPGADTATTDDLANTNAEGDFRRDQSVRSRRQLASTVNNDEPVTLPLERTHADRATPAQMRAVESNGASRVKRRLGLKGLSGLRERQFDFTVLGFQIKISRGFTAGGPGNSGLIQTNSGQESEIPMLPSSHNSERDEALSRHRLGHSDEVLEEERARAAKLERIRIIRREKTKQRQAQQGLTCKCDESCHCMSGSQGSNDTSDHTKGSTPDPDISLHALHDTIHPIEQSRPSHENIPRSPIVYCNPVNFRGVGGHFDARGTQSGTDSSGSAGRIRSRTSQATTAVGSTASGSSLLESGPSLRRSNSMPLPMAYQPASQYRPEVRDALNNTHVFEATLHPHGMPHLEPLPENHHGEQSQALGDSDSTDETAHTDTEPTSLANIPSPDATQDQPPAPSAPGQIHTPQGGSDDPTPRARSQHDADDGSPISLERGPDEVSVVLDEVAERTSAERSLSVSEE